MPDTPAAPDISTMTPDVASATLAQMQIDAHPPAPLSPTTAAEANARLQTLTANKEWGQRLLAGGMEERREFQRLTQLAAGTDEVKDAIDGATPESFTIETIGPGELNSRDRATAVAMFRDAGLEDGVISEAFNGGRVTAREVAATKALQSSRHGDAGWRQRFLAGGWAENREQMLINIILTSEIDESR
jgi:hypothetical protein